MSKPTVTKNKEQTVITLTPEQGTALKDLLGGMTPRAMRDIVNSNASAVDKQASIDILDYFGDNDLLYRLYNALDS